MTAPTAVLGLSHLGINYAAAWASFGQPVIAVDFDADLVDRVGRGDLPVHEPGLPELLVSVRGDLRFSSDFSLLAECPLIIVARDVPTSDDNTIDLSPVHGLMVAAQPHLQPNATLVVMSQVPPGFSRALAARLPTVNVYYWVETLVFGEAVKRALEPERLIVGCSDPSAPLPEQFKQGLERFNCPIFPMRYESAELTKTAINAYLAAAVTCANTMSDLCEALGADWAEMVPALRTDRRIGPAAYIRPGLGIAGGNLERDLNTLQHLGAEHVVNTTFLDAMVNHSAQRLTWITRQLQAHVHEPRPTLAMWGLTYKKNTRSVKNSPSLRVIDSLSGRACIRAWDPAIAPGELQVSADVLGDAYTAAEGADALLVMCDWDDFLRADLSRLHQCLRQPVILDAAGILQSRRAELDGFTYVSMGRA